MTHIGDRVTDLVDGQLGPEATDRAHAHLAGCIPCREQVETERLMKSRLASLPGPQPSADLVDRLMMIRLADAAPPGERPAAGPGPFGGGPPPPDPAAGSVLSPVASRGAVTRGVRSAPRGGRAVAGRPAGRSVRGGSVRPTGRRLHHAGQRQLVVAMFSVLSLSVISMGAAGFALSAVPLAPGAMVPTVATLMLERTAMTWPFMRGRAGTTSVPQQKPGAGQTLSPADARG